MTKTVTKQNNFSKRKRSKLVFYSILISVPVLHYLVFYVFINFNSILMAFRSYNVDGTFINAHFSNFGEALNQLFGKENLFALYNSFVFLAVHMFISTPLALLFSYYMYKKRFGHGFFKVMLFMPQLLSGVILGAIYKYLCVDGYSWLCQNVLNIEATNLLAGTDTQLWAMIAFNILMGFGVNVLTYSGSMSAINDSLVEAAQLDGANSFQEFIHVIMPMIYPTFVTMVVIMFAGVFIDQYHVFTIYDVAAGNMRTVGYWLYVSSQYSGVRVKDPAFPTYPVLSAMGLILTAIILPLTLLLRRMLNKYGPSAD